MEKKIMHDKPNILFFSRTYHSTFFPLLRSDKYNSIHITLTKREKKEVESLGGIVYGCFEEEFDNIPEVKISDNYLETSMCSDRFLKGKNIDERKEILAKEISFWRTIINRHNPKIVLNEVIALEISEVLYIETKSYGALYLGWLPGLLPNTFYWLTNPFNASLDKMIFLTKPNERSIQLAENYVTKVVQENEKPFYVKNLQSRFNIKRGLGLIKSTIKTLYKKTIKNSFTYEDYYRYKIIELRNLINSFIHKYDKFNNSEDIEYVIYPLHFEPEATLSYFSPFFSNQVANIENISKSLTVNQQLIVKEHPQQKGMLLNKKFRRLKRICPNLIYLPAETPSEVLIKECLLVVTLTSTLGWEALIHGKPVILMGNTFYDKHPSVSIAKSFEELKNIIRNDGYTYPKRNETIKYTAQIIQYSQRGVLSKSNNLVDAYNLKAVTESLENMLDIKHSYND